MKIGIIGYGMVGKAVEYGFKNNSNTIIINDPEYKNSISVIDMCKQDPNFIFVCVPTPTINGAIDTAIMNDVIATIAQHYKGIVIIKSTVTPNYLTLYADKYPEMQLVSNPEFLSDRTANQDFIEPIIMVIGSENFKNVQLVEQLYTHHSNVNMKNLHYTDLEGAALLKYAFNTFYSTKVTFMNALYEIVNESNTSMNWDEFKKVLGSNPHIGNMHLDVPGHDGLFGYGGKCFPKDVGAFIEYANTLSTPFTLLNTVENVNKINRKKPIS